MGVREACLEGKYYTALCTAQILHRYHQAGFGSASRCRNRHLASARDARMLNASGARSELAFFVDRLVALLSERLPRFFKSVLILICISG